MSIVYTIINLLILYAFFRKFLFGRVNKILEERREQIEGINAHLDEELEKAKAEHDKYEEEARLLAEEKEQTLADWRGRGYEEYNRIVEEAKVEAGRIIAGARKDAENEAQIARDKNQAALKEMVIDAAAHIAMHTADEESEGALYDEFIRKLTESEEAS